MNMDKTNMSRLISEIDIKGMWETNDVHWENVDEKVNILVGTNGSGKSTFLRIINNAVKGDIKELKKQIDSGKIIFKEGPSIEYVESRKSIELKETVFVDVDYINTFDAPTSKKSDKSPLFQALDAVLYQRVKEVDNFTDYRMKLLNPDIDHDRIRERISLLFNTIDKFFELSGKRIKITPDNKIVFYFPDNECIIEPEQLSSGEKQLLIIFFRVFLKDEKPSLLLMDEPELSLHIEWQNKLIEAIRSLNPNCQIIMTTHSPSIFADGWEDKLIFMEDIMKTEG